MKCKSWISWRWKKTFIEFEIRSKERCQMRSCSWQIQGAAQKMKCNFCKTQDGESSMVWASSWYRICCLNNTQLQVPKRDFEMVHLPLDCSYFRISSWGLDPQYHCVFDKLHILPLLPFWRGLWACEHSKSAPIFCTRLTSLRNMFWHRSSHWNQLKQAFLIQ